jgi:S-adenosylmethionine-diacylgycerolhomoserine-N-methlytransferase
MRRLEALRDDLGILRQMLRGMPQAASHAHNLQAFYAAQANGYDRFRERLLRGRVELIAGLLQRLPAQARVVELGGGTGRNLEFFADRLDELASFELVDLCPALLEQARHRVAAFEHVRTIEADATTYRPASLVDCVYFSYSLTMIPQWRLAIDNALAMLKPGGVLGVVDFYTSATMADPGLVQHGAMTRMFWTRWFAHDGVHLNPQHLSTLRALMPDSEIVEARASVPYLPLLRVPYYTFIGRKR